MSGQIRAVDPSSGAERWRTASAQDPAGPPMVFRAAGDAALAVRIVYPSDGGDPATIRLDAHDAATGAEWWRWNSSVADRPASSAGSTSD